MDHQEPETPRQTPIWPILLLIAAVIAIPFMIQPRHKPAPPVEMANPVAPSASGKIVMLDFYTDWCGYCKKMDAEIYPRADVQKALQPFELRKVNAESSPANRELTRKYRIDGFPTVVFVDAKGNEVYRIVGYRPPEDFIRELETASNKAGGK